MSKSEILPIVVVLIAGIAGYLALNPAAANELTNWLRQEIRKEMPDAKQVVHPNYTPVVPEKGF